MKLYIIVPMLILCMHSATLYAVTIGSDTAVNRFTVSVTINNGDVVAAFGFLSAGFSLSSSGVTATVRTTFPIGGTMSLNGGTMVLGHDLELANNTIVSSLGNITANGFALSLSSTKIIPSTIPGSITCFTWKDIKVVLNGDLTLRNSCIIFDGLSSIIGQGHALTLAPTCTLQVKAGASLLLKDLVIDGINSNKIACLDSKSTLSLENVRWIQNGNYDFNVGRFHVISGWSLEGENRRFAYQTNQQSTIGSYATMELLPSFTFSYNPSVNNSDFLSFADETAQFIVNAATLHSSKAGLRFRKNTLVIDGNTTFASDASIKAQGIHIGDGVSVNNNVILDWLAESGIELVSGFLVYDNV